MRTRTNVMPWLTAAALVGALVPNLANACDAVDCADHAKVCEAQGAENTEPQPQAAAGMRVSIDPITGEYIDSPVPSSQAAAVTAPSVVPKQEALQGGGFKLDTSGVRHSFVATANPGGLPHTSCVEQHRGAEDQNQD